MGCSHTKEVRARGSDHHPNRGAYTQLLITDDEQKLIKRTWRYLSDDMTVGGMKLFLLIFDKKPSVKDLFPFHDLTGEDLLNHPYFRTHACHFMQGIGAAVDNMDSLDRLAPVLLALGEQHCNTKGFVEDYFELFIGCLLQVWHDELGKMFTPEVHIAWEKMFYFIMMKLREGYDQAISKQLTGSPASTRSTTQGRLDGDECAQKSELEP